MHLDVTISLLRTLAPGGGVRIPILLGESWLESDQRALKKVSWDFKLGRMSRENQIRELLVRLTERALIKHLTGADPSDAPRAYPRLV